MANDVTDESQDKPSSSASILAIPVTEGFILAFATAILYMMTSSYQFGYQQSFGFTYISIGVEDVTWTIRIFLAPIFIAVFAAVAISIFIRIPKKARFLPANQLILLMLPPAMLIGLKIFHYHNPLENVSKEMIFLIVAYYIVGAGHVMSSYKTRTAPNEFLPGKTAFQIVSILILGFMFIILSYDIGRREAYHLENVEVCDNNSSGKSDRIALQRTADIVVCARTDFDKKIVYNDFEYTKLGDGKAFKFHNLQFHPDIINQDNP